MIDDRPSIASKCRIGPSGWSYPDWNGVVYPPNAPTRFDALAFIARYFDAVEVNVSFYRNVTARTTAAWVRRTTANQRFHFTFKLHQAFTHLRKPYSAAAAQKYLHGLQPVADASRLGCILIQFPWSFRRSAENTDWIRRLADDFGQHPLVIEFRHDDWNTPETLHLLRQLHIGYCNLDQPILRHCPSPSAHVTSPVGYVRFHGRRANTWFARDIESYQRYDFLYSPEQLEEWIPRIHRISADCERVYIFSNNHYRGQGPANALQLRAMLQKSPVEVPATMISHFPQLDGIAKTTGTHFPETLF